LWCIDLLLTDCLWAQGLNETRPWSTIQRVTASDWKDPASYKPEYTDLFPEVHSTEDPHVYTDAEGYYHAVFHHCYQCPKPCVCGGHAYSLDGKQWHCTHTSNPPLNRRNISDRLLAFTDPYINGSAYWENVTLTSGEVIPSSSLFQRSCHKRK